MSGLKRCLLTSFQLKLSPLLLKQKRPSMPDFAPHANLDLIKAVAHRLEPLLSEVAFVGGSTVALYATRPGLAPIRPTDDVDLIVEVASRVRYHALSERLRELGFKEDVDAKILCRWRVDEIIVDVMPTDTTILGFANRWYDLALATVTPLTLEPGLTIRLITAPCFIGTKIEAFRDRGKGDFLFSDDMDDIVSVLLSRAEIVSEVRDTLPEPCSYIAHQFEQWLENIDFVQSLSGHLNPDPTSQSHLTVLLERIQNIAALK
jgi:hypothetical protein